MYRSSTNSRVRRKKMEEDRPYISRGFWKVKGSEGRRYRENHVRNRSVKTIGSLVLIASRRPGGQKVQTSSADGRRNPRSQPYRDSPTHLTSRSQGRPRQRYPLRYSAMRAEKPSAPWSPRFSRCSGSGRAGTCTRRREGAGTSGRGNILQEEALQVQRVAQAPTAERHSY